MGFHFAGLVVLTVLTAVVLWLRARECGHLLRVTALAVLILTPVWLLVSRLLRPELNNLATGVLTAGVGIVAVILLLRPPRRAGAVLLAAAILLVSLAMVVITPWRPMSAAYWLGGGGAAGPYLLLIVVGGLMFVLSLLPPHWASHD